MARCGVRRRTLRAGVRARSAMDGAGPVGVVSGLSFGCRPAGASTASRDPFDSRGGTCLVDVLQLHPHALLRGKGRWMGTGG